MARGTTYQQGAGVEVALREFAPDLDPTTPGILTDMSGAIPTTKGFRAEPSAEVIGDALPHGCYGAITYHNSNGQMYLFAGTSEHLYRYDGTTATVFDGRQNFALMTTTNLRPVKNSGWRFYQFGDDLLAVARYQTPQISVNGINAFVPIPGITDLGTGSTLITTGVSCAGFAFMFQGQQWYCSAAGMDQDSGGVRAWLADIQTLAANGILYDVPGEIVGAAAFYRTVVVFKEHGIWLGSFVGPPNTWSFQLISSTTGTWSQECIVPLPDAIAFLGSDDFYITTGSVPIRIPNSLKEWFFETADPNLLANTQGHYDQNDATVYWHFVSRNPPVPEVPDLYVAYNVRARRWAKGDLTCTNVATCVFGENSVPHFDDLNRPFSMTGTARPMSLTTGFYGIPSRHTQLFRVRAKWETRPEIQVLSASYTNTLGVPVVSAQPTPALGGDDWFNLRQYARYHQLKLDTVGEAELSALAYEARTGGVR